MIDLLGLRRQGGCAKAFFIVSSLFCSTLPYQKKLPMTLGILFCRDLYSPCNAWRGKWGL